jgi:hypothetical protein
MATTKSPTEEDRKKSDIDVDAVTAGVPQGDRPGPPFRSFFIIVFRVKSSAVCQAKNISQFSSATTRVFFVY